MTMMDGIQDIRPGVVTGDNLLKLLKHAKENHYAIPAFNCTSSSMVNAALEAAREKKSAVMIQVSNAGAAFVAGTGIGSANAAAIGSVALAMHVRTVSPYYGVPVVLHSDHCALCLMQWFDKLLEANEQYFALHGEPLFSSHMLDFSEEPDDENIAICKKYFERMVKMKLWLEMEIGVMREEEDGVDDEGADAHEQLYTTPEQVCAVYNELSKIGDMFSISAAFGNVHGVYKTGNFSLQPYRLGNHQRYVKEQLKCESDLPIFFVMHGGSGSSEEDIKRAVSNGVVKMNVDTDTQWAYWDGLREFEAENHDYLQCQIGNPTGAHQPNKKFYDPRVWIRKAEQGMIKRCGAAMDMLGSSGKYQPQLPEHGSIPMFNFTPEEKSSIDMVKTALGM